MISAIRVSWRLTAVQVHRVEQIIQALLAAQIAEARADQRDLRALQRAGAVGVEFVEHVLRGRCEGALREVADECRFHRGVADARRQREALPLELRSQPSDVQLLRVLERRPLRGARGALRADIRPPLPRGGWGGRRIPLDIQSFQCPLHSELGLSEREVPSVPGGNPSFIRYMVSRAWLPHLT